MFEKAIKKWWFYAIITVLFFLPALTQKPFPPEQTPLLIMEVMQNPLVYGLPAMFPFMKILTAAVLASTLIFKNAAGRFFALFFIFLLGGVAVLQNISVKTQFGTAFLLGNFLVQTVVVLSWVYEVFAAKNSFRKTTVSWWKVMCLLLGFFAFWMPAKNGLMSFEITGIATNEALLTYCMITPVLLSFLFLFHPDINKVTLRVTSFAGLLFGIMNMITWFFLNTEFWWMGIVHFPLMINSIVGLILSMRPQINVWQK